MGQEYPGWRRSVDRTGLRMNSLQTGNFSGYFTKIGDGVTRFMRETPAPQQILVRFTTEEAGKIISRTRILTRKTGNSSGGNRRVDPEIGVQRAGLSHWSATAFPPLPGITRPLLCLPGTQTPAAGCSAVRPQRTSIATQAVASLPGPRPSPVR